MLEHHVLSALGRMAGADMPAEDADVHSGTRNLPLEALIWGTLSAVSLPIGAVAGIYFSPVDPYFVANTIAFGAGCLLFAVTIEMYGEQLHHVEKDGFESGKIEMGICLVSAVIGSLIYLQLNRWVEAQEGGEGDEETAKLAPKEHTEAGAGKTRLKAVHHMKDDDADKGKTLALGMLMGIIADGIPESILIGFLASEGHLSIMFVFSIFVANFPESFSSSSLLHQKKTFSVPVIIALWTFPMVLTGCLASLACWMVPPWAQAQFGVKCFAAFIEGVAGGMMLAMIGSVMLPQAYTMAKEAHMLHRGDVPGVLCVCGFLCAVAMKVAGGYAEKVIYVEEGPTGPKIHGAHFF